jgi:hypothetical protein
MMDGPSLQDKINRGMGVAARKLGELFIVYRPRGPLAPTSSRNRIIKLYASFNSDEVSYRRVAAYGTAEWYGVYDASYTRPGDYMVGASATFFITGQRPVLPVQCVRTNRVITLVRSAAPQNGGYAGLTSATAVDLLVGWPASILAAGSRVSANGEATKLASWSLLLPNLPLNPEAGDIVKDDIARNYVVGSAEQSDLGWRLSIRQVVA